jgi:hypothetical protein
MLCLLFWLELRLEDDSPLFPLLAPYLVDVHGCDQPYAITHISLRFIFLCNQCFVLGYIDRLDGES